MGVDRDTEQRLTQSLFAVPRLFMLGRRTFPKHYGWRLIWRWAKDAAHD